MGHPCMNLNVVIQREAKGNRTVSRICKVVRRIGRREQEPVPLPVAPECSVAALYLRRRKLIFLSQSRAIIEDSREQARRIL
jgi:hypothetical protein